MAVQPLSNLGEAISEFLKGVHADNALLPIRRPGPTGAFPDATYGGLIRQECLVMVPDTNVLLQDIGDSCSRGRRLTLVTAANCGAIRLFCAQHVVDEVWAHAVEYAQGRKLDVEEFLWRWTNEYLPQLRTIPDRAIPESVLTPTELWRVRRLNASKDVPSVMLAMTLGAFFLSKDEAPWESVYDEEADAEELLNWLEPVRGGNTADELGKVGFMSLIVPALVCEGVAHVFNLIRRNAPWAFIPIASALALAAYRVPRANYEKLWSGIGFAADVFMAARERYEAALDRFRAMEPPVPSWEDLADTLPSRAVLLRACLATLARSPYSHRSAEELAEMLPELYVGQGQALVRETLRANAAFSNPHRGRWQVGYLPQRIASRDHC